MTRMTTREVSAALFGNEKMAEVVVALAAESGLATAQQVATRLRINHDLARKVLLRLVTAGVVRALPKEGGRRSAQYYEPVQGTAWDALLALATVVNEARVSVADAAPAAPQP